MAGRKMERAPGKEQKVLEVGIRHPLWNQHVSTRLARWLELQLNKSGSFSITGLGGLRVTARKRKGGGGGSYNHRGTTKPSLCALPVLALSLGQLSRAESRQQEAAACTLTCPGKHAIPTPSHSYNLHGPKIKVIQGFNLHLPVITPSSTWQLWTSVLYVTRASYSPASSLRTGSILREKLPLRKAESWTDTRDLMCSAVFRRPEGSTSSTMCGSWWVLGGGQVSGSCQRQRQNQGCGAGRRECREGERWLEVSPTLPSPHKDTDLCWPWHTFLHAASTARMSCRADASSSLTSFWGSGGKAAQLNSLLWPILSAPCFPPLLLLVGCGQL